MTTAEYPFYTAEGEWVNAGELEAGDEIRTAEWGTGVVASVYEVTQPEEMYNFTAGVAHTYFVGEQEWLVHNCNVGTFNGRSFATSAGKQITQEAMVAANYATDILQDLKKSTFGQTQINDLKGGVFRNLTIAATKINGQFVFTTNRIYGQRKIELEKALGDLGYLNNYKPNTLVFPICFKIGDEKTGVLRNY